MDDGAAAQGRDGETQPPPPETTPPAPPPPPATPASPEAARSAATDPPASPAATVTGSTPATGGKRAAGARRERAHPYRNEGSTEAELRHDPRRVTLLWFGIATALAIGGMFLDRTFNPDPLNPNPAWAKWSLVPLFAGLALLGFGILRNPKWERVTMVGWLLFASYWGLTAIDLFVSEGQDYVNFVFALVGVYFFTYLAYHQWLSAVRRVDNAALHFLNVSTFVAAGSYFVIDKVEPVRVWLITVVARQTKWMLDLFGQGTAKGMVYIEDLSRGAPTASGEGPSTFLYPSTFATCPDGSRSLPADQYATYQQAYPGVEPGELFRTWCHDNMQLYADNAWERMLHYAPDGDHIIGSVTIILACTALQSIMLFVGLFMGTRAPLRQKLWTSLWVGVLVYVLNLVRNTGIIWFFGQGDASFWVMHNAIGKGGSLIAMIGIAFLVFRTFPAFFTGLVGVLDLPERDGPIERTLGLGRRRPGT